MNTQLGGLRFASQRLQPRAMAGAFLYQMVAWAKVLQKWNGTVVTLPLPQVHTPVQIPKAGSPADTALESEISNLPGTLLLSQRPTSAAPIVRLPRQ